MDLGDKQSCYCVLDGRGEVIEEGCGGTNKKAITKVFGPMGRCRIALEVGTHSPWVSRLLRTLGHEVVVANPRQVKLISTSSRKDDRWTRKRWHGWCESTPSCSDRSSIGVRKRRCVGSA
jgi:transposase